MKRASVFGGLVNSVVAVFYFKRYLCDFTYYTSLYLSHGRSAFIHVPPLGKPYSRDDLGRALQAIIRGMLELLDQAEEKIHCQQHIH